MIPDEAVYAAAFAVYGSGFDGSPVKDAWLKDFRTALEAAVPYMLAEAWDKGFTAHVREWVTQRGDPSHPITRDNPYKREA